MGKRGGVRVVREKRVRDRFRVKGRIGRKIPWKPDPLTIFEALVNELIVYHLIPRVGPIKQYL